MGKETGIEWADSTWNPIRGCSRVSEGCRNCYAEGIAARFSGRGHAYEGLATFKTIGEGTPEEHVEPRWTGEVRFIENHLRDPLKWKEPAKIFVNSMSDLFHPSVRDEWIADIFDVMARAPQHTYLILTKRPDRMRDVLKAWADPQVSSTFEKAHSQTWPPRNWWFGVSVEDQETADHRIIVLAQTIAAVRWVSYEPALGPVNWSAFKRFMAIDWLVAGGESGPRARPMNPQWAREARDICRQTGVPFFFKQWGEFLPGDQSNSDLESSHTRVGQFDRLGKHVSGSLLDGVEWKEYPKC